ncbi:MAG: hypothetical protein QF577_00505, partial [Phycisphaerae bacterium]|nr:hypothetical protein [Phycisphaerae bacterium]
PIHGIKAYRKSGRPQLPLQLVKVETGNLTTLFHMVKALTKATRTVRTWTLGMTTGWDYMMVARVGGEFTLRGLQESLCALAARVTGAGERKAASHED